MATRKFSYAKADPAMHSASAAHAAPSLPLMCPPVSKSDQQRLDRVDEHVRIGAPAVRPRGFELGDLDAEHRAARQLHRAGMQLGQAETAGHFVFQRHYARLEHVAIQ